MGDQLDAELVQENSNQTHEHDTQQPGDITDAQHVCPKNTMPQHIENASTGAPPQITPNTPHPQSAPHPEHQTT